MTGRNIETAFPLTPLQEGMLYHSIRHSDPSGYWGQCVAEFEGSLDEATFREAWDGIVRRHQAFRTFFVWEGRDRPLQVVRERVELTWDVHDWSAKSEEERERDWGALLNDDWARPVDLTVAPVMRFVLVRLAPTRHRMLWGLHHMLADGWSTRVVFQELFSRYEALLSGSTLATAAPPSFAKFVTWLSTRDSAAAERYWREQLSGLRAATPLPGTAPGQGGGPKVIAERVLTADVTRALQQAGTRMRVTPNTLALGAWALVLSTSIDGAEDVAFGVTVSERPAEIPGVGGSVGLYLNTVPVRVPVSGAASIADWLAAIQRTLMDARDHGAGGLADIHAWSDVPAGAPLIRSLVAYESFPPDLDSRTGKASLRLASVDVWSPSDVPLALLVHPGERLTLQLGYDTALYTWDAAERLLRVVARALEGLAEDDARTLDDVDLVDSDMKQDLLHVLSGADAPAPESTDVLDLIEETARLTPEAVAVRDADSALMYGALDAQANRLAHRIAREARHPDMLLGIPAERRASTIVSVVAALKAGRGYTMIDPRQPRRRLERVLAFVDRVLSGSDDGRWGDQLLPSDDLADEPSTRLATGSDPEGVAYVVWTSGSTGQPKGVVVERRHLARSTAARFAHYGTEPDVHLLMSSLAVDSSVAGLFGTLCSGGCLVLSPDRIEQDVAALVTLVEDVSVTTTLMLPSLYRALLEEGDARRLGSLRRVIVAGEACSRGVVDLHQERLPSVELHNEYGPSEATVWVTVADLTTDTAREVTIGRPIPGVSIYVLDPRGRPVVIGAPGEICIGGGTVARGYLGDSRATAERFVEDKLSGVGRLYRTGDRGRFLDDGRLEFLGRVDDQIKVRGYRVEPAEVERAIEAHPGVSEAAVALGAAPARRLVAYVTVENAPPSAEELTAFVRERVPDHMVPSGFVVLPVLPRTAAGKLDRRGLTEAGGTELGIPRGRGRAPATPREIELAEIWKGVLGVEEVDVDADFFEIGGDSLLSIRLLSRAGRAGLSISPEDFFAGPTISRLAARTGGPTVPAEQGIVSGALPLTPIQSWFFENITEGRDHWNQSFLVDAPAHLDADTFRSVVTRLISHHDALRLRFPRGRNGWTQEIGPEPQVAPVRVVDVTGLSVSERSDRIEQEADTEHGSLDISAGDLFRTVLFVGDAGLRRVLLLAHHLVVDAVSWGILLEDLSLLVGQAAEGSPLRLPPKTASVAAWSAGLDDVAAGVDAASAVRYWAGAARPSGSQGAPEGDRRGGASGRVADAETVTLTLAEDETRALMDEVAHRLGASMEAVLLGSFLTAWNDWTGSGTLRVDVEGHGRDAVTGLDVSRTVGWFTTASPLVLVAGDEGGAESVRAVERAISGLPGGRATHGLLRYRAPDESVSEALRSLPPSDVVFNYLSTVEDVLPAGSDFAWSGESVGCARSDDAPRAYRVEVNALVRRGCLTVNVEYSKKEYDAEALEELVAALRTALLQLVAKPAASRPTFDLSGLDDAGLSRVADLLAEVDGA